MILLDTHVLIWLQSGNERLGRRTRKLIDRALTDDHLAVASITFWEISLLASKKRLSLTVPVAQLRTELLNRGLAEIPLNGATAIAATELDRLHPDPADRFILATAEAYGATLVTADDRILKWKGQIKRRDARL